MRGRENRFLLLMVAPAIVVGAAFFLLPLAHLAVVGATGKLGLGAYTAANPVRRAIISMLESQLILGPRTTGTIVTVKDDLSGVSTTAGQPLVFAASPIS